jgi:hypothetical protein
MIDEDTDAGRTTLKQRIQDEMVVDPQYPDHDDLAEVLNGLIAIGRQSHKIRPRDAFYNLAPGVNAVVYCLGQYAACELDAQTTEVCLVSDVEDATGLDRADLDNHSLLTVTGGGVRVSPDRRHDAVEFVRSQRGLRRHNCADANADTDSQIEE